MTSEGKMKTNWLDPINRMKFQAAFESGAPQVTLRDGRKFHITYLGETVRVKPESGLVPMGTFNLEVVLSPLWLESETEYTG